METADVGSIGTERAATATATGGDWRRLCRAGGIASMLLLAYSILTMVQIPLLGGQPATAEEAFQLLQESRAVALLRLDLPTLVAMPLYYLLFLGLAAALWRADRVLVLVSTALAFVGVTLLLSTPTALSLIALSDKHAAATSEAARLQYLAAGEALLAADIWHATNAILGGTLAQVAAVLISLVMLRSDAFGRVTGVIGVAMHGLDLAHIVVGLFVPIGGLRAVGRRGPLLPGLVLPGRANPAAPCGEGRGVSAEPLGARQARGAS